MLLIPLLRRQRHAHLCEYKASLVYLGVPGQPSYIEIKREQQKNVRMGPGVGHITPELRMGEAALHTELQDILGMRKGGRREIGEGVECEKEYDGTRQIPI